MKKTDLYRCFDGIKQDKELKDVILKAVEEKDKVTVIKRPLFVPIMVMLLLCLNIGMAAKLVIFNKSQINMAELKARTSLSSASDMEEERIREEIAERSEKEKLKSKQIDEEKRTAFQSYVDRFQKAISESNYSITEEWLSDESYDPTYRMPYFYVKDAEENPEYADGETVYDGSWLYRRYVERIEISTETSVNNKPHITTESVFTNHEFIVAYDGECVPENIVSITESDVNPEKLDEKQIAETLKNTDNEDFRNKVRETAEYYINENDDDTYNIRDYGLLDNFYMYPPKSTDKSTLVKRCYYALGNKDNQEWNKNDADIYNFYFIDENGTDVTEDIFNAVYSAVPSNYWKDTCYLSEGGPREQVRIPDIIGMTTSEAEKALEAVGLKMGVRNYVSYWDYSGDSAREFGQVVSFDTNTTKVYKGSGVNVYICAKSVPNISGKYLDEAVEILQNSGLDYEIKYLNGVSPDNTDLFVDYCDPYDGTPITNDKIKLFAADPDIDTAAELIGSVISLKRRHIYYGEEAEKVIEGIEPSEEEQIILGEYPAYKKWFDEAVCIGNFYGDEYFKVETVNTFSTRNVWTIPYISCGDELENGLEEAISQYPFYKNHEYKFLDIETSKYPFNGFDYLLSYRRSDGTDIYAYIDTMTDKNDNERILDIYLSGYLLLDGTSS